MQYNNGPVVAARDKPRSSASSDGEKASLDLTQRFERKLARYNASDNVFKKWLFEIVSWLISAISMVAIVLIYVKIQDRPHSLHESSLTWTNVLGKISTAALIVPTTEALGQLKWNWFKNSSKAVWDFEIFDKASRGPWGALMLLLRTRGRSLAALGALLVLLLLAIDTFFQQVVVLSVRWELQAMAAVAPRTSTYQVSQPDEYTDGAPFATKDRELHNVVQKFSYENGTQPVVFGNGTRPDIPVVRRCFLA